MKYYVHHAVVSDGLIYATFRDGSQAATKLAEVALGREGSYSLVTIETRDDEPFPCVGQSYVRCTHYPFYPQPTAANLS